MSRPGRVRRLLRLFPDHARTALWGFLGHRVPGGERDRVVVQAVIEGAGYGVVRHYTGHGVGRAMHEPPNVPNYGTAGSGMVMRQGMVLALEPMATVGDPDTVVLDDGARVHNDITAQSRAGVHDACRQELRTNANLGLIGAYRARMANDQWFEASSDAEIE